MNLNRLAKAASIAAMTLGVAFAATPAQKASAQVRGAGASSITPLVNPLLRQNGNTYSITGSGTGRTLLQNGTTDYASSDNNRGSFDFDTVVINPFDISVVFPYNLPGVDSVSLDPTSACAIVAGTVDNWNQVPIDGTPLADLDPGTTLVGPDLPIRRVVRGDNSGTSAVVQSGFINSVCNQIGFSINAFDPSNGALLGIPNQRDTDIIVPPADDPYGNGNEDNPDNYSSGVANAIANNEGAIGYVERAIAINAGLPRAVNAAATDGVDPEQIAAGPNYFIFRADGNTDRADGSQRDFAAAQALCNSILSNGVPEGYLPPSDSSDSCDAINP